MRRSGPILAVSIVLLADAVALIGVARNRSGDPDALLELTEREVPMPPVEKENTGLALSLDWGVSDGGRWDRPDWFDRTKLEEIGYDCRLPPDDPGAEIWYRKAKSRQVYAALEYGGEAWAQWLAAQERSLAALAEKVESREVTPAQLDSEREYFAKRRLTMSRLFVVDVGTDPAALRGKHPDKDRFIVTPALVDLSYWKDPESEGGAAHVGGYVREVLIGSINVPKDKRGLLDQILARDDQERRDNAGNPEWSWEPKEPRYAATVAYGQRHEPWLVSLRLTEPPVPAPAR